MVSAVTLWYQLATGISAEAVGTIAAPMGNPEHADHGIKGRYESLKPCNPKGEAVITEVKGKSHVIEEGCFYTDQLAINW